MCVCIYIYISLASKQKNVIANGDSIAKVSVESWYETKDDLNYFIYIYI